MIRQYVLDPCPVKPLTPLPEGDACAKSLDEGRGVHGNGTCPQLTDAMKAELPCLAHKITALGIPYSGPTATIRNPAYQNHLAEIWQKLHRDFEKLTPQQEGYCAARKSLLTAAKGDDHHRIRFEPPYYDPNDSHASGRAVDIAPNTAYELMRRLTTEWTDVQTYVQDATSNPYLDPQTSTLRGCNLIWGGRFSKFDPIHFQMPLTLPGTQP